MDRGLVGRGAGAAVAGASVAAMIVQDHTDALPLGLFNEGGAALAALANACLALGGAVLALFAWEFWRGRAHPLGSRLRALLASFVLFEAILTAIDVGWVSRDVGEYVGLGGPYTERRSAAGEWLTLKKPHQGSPYGFRTETPYARRPEDLRVLFLGDSYTEGSGAAPDCNYPEVAARTAARALGRPVDAMNAGVAGYGPRDAARLLRHLVAEGYAADAIVYGLFLENDFRDNLPGTVRRVVAGINFRFPASLWLRTFHPLNTRSFRYAVFFERSSSFVRPGLALVHREEGHCDLSPVPVEHPSEELGRDLLRKLALNHESDAPVAVGEVERGIAEMREIAREQGVPFVLVVFPDRLLVDAALREALDVHALPPDSPVLRFVARQPGPVVDTTPALARTPGAWRADDSHLSDLGNVVTGEVAGRAIAALLGAHPGGTESPSGSPGG